MKAAVVTAFQSPPRYLDFPEPAADGRGMIVDVLAAGLHPRVRSQADGSHYTSTDELPLVPGIDGVGRGPDGELRYFVLPDTVLGSMATRTVIDPRRSIVLPAGTDPVAVAAGMNPGMSAWVALRRRIVFAPGSRVLVLGATGNAGRMAIEVAKLFGAATVVGAGRRPVGEVAPPDGTTAGRGEIVSLDEVAKVAADVDVVLDYLWGPPAVAAMVQIVTEREDRGRPLSWVQIGSVAGPEAAIPSAALRASGLTIVGSGQGSVATADIVAELPALARAIIDGSFDVNARALPLADVTGAWTEAARSRHRIVLTPN